MGSDIIKPVKELI